jgi:hypothetical protein
MSERPYENREIDEKFVFIKDKLELIHVQTLKTNGRVSKGEEQMQEMKEWRSNLMGRIAIVTFCIAGIASAVITKLFNE